MAGFGYNIGLDGHSVTPLTEKEAEEVAQGIRDVYGMARQEMLEKVARRMGSGLHRPGWAERKASEILGAHHEMAGILDRAERSRTGLLDGIMDRAYHSGSQKFYSDMGAILGDVRHISPNSMKAGYILADLNNSLDAAHRRILRQFDDKYAAIIGVASAEMSTGVINTREAVGKALQAFADQGITGFIDRGGHHWTLENYSEMAVLTAINRSTIAGYVDTMQSYGYDLAQIDGHYGSCPICEAWEHVIVSVSGQDPRYPSIADAEADGCFHPRCLHSVTTYYEGVSHGEARDRPREIRDASPEYTARSKQRYMERQIRKYKDRAIVAQTPQQRQQALNKAKEWSNALDEHIARQPKHNYLYRHGEREKPTGTIQDSASAMSTRSPTSWPTGDGGMTPKALSDLKDYARNSGIRLDTDSFRHFEGSPETVREVIDSISTVARDFPGMLTQRGGLHLSNSYGMDDEDYATTSGKTITLNNNAFRNRSALEADYAKRAEERWFVPGTSVRSIGYHEAGHAVRNAYQIPLSVADSVNPDNISEYAGKSRSETIAESFSAVYSGVRNESALTIFDMCGRIISGRE